MQRNINISGRVISYELQRKRVKNINLRVRGDGTVYVSASPAVPAAVIEAFLRSRGDFILDCLRRASLKAAAPENWADGERVSVLGRDYALRVFPAAKNTAELGGSVLALYVKEPENAQLREKTARKLLDALCAETVRGLCEEAYPLFADCCPTPPELRFRRMKSRWGSCAATKRILTFNKALVHTPMECVEYVVYHEFCHFLHQNHSRAFKDALAGFVPDWKARKKRLGEYSAYV